MFGVSFLEITLVGLVALVVVGPQKLPGMMRTLGEWLGKLRRLTADMRAQTGIDDILREEGIDGVRELKTMLRGAGVNHHAASRVSRETYSQPPDALVEFPVEGADSAGSLPDDLLSAAHSSPDPPAPAPSVDSPAAATDSPAASPSSLPKPHEPQQTTSTNAPKESPTAPPPLDLP